MKREEHEELNMGENEILGLCALAVGAVVLIATALLIVMRKKKVAKMKAEQAE